MGLDRVIIPSHSMSIEIGHGPSPLIAPPIWITRPQVERGLIGTDGHSHFPAYAGPCQDHSRVTRPTRRDRPLRARCKQTPLRNKTGKPALRHGGDHSPYHSVWKIPDTLSGICETRKQKFATARVHWHKGHRILSACIGDGIGGGTVPEPEPTVIGGDLVNPALKIRKS